MKKIFYLGLFIQSIVISNAQNAIPDSLFGINSSLEVTPGMGEKTTDFLLQPNGKIIYAGWGTGSNNDFFNDMVRFDVCGIMDSSFGTNGMVRHKFDQRNRGYKYNLQPDGKILCAGTQAPSNSGSQQIPFVARYNSDGSVDTNFANMGTNALRFDLVSSGSFRSAYLMPDSRIVCIGDCRSNINGGVNGAGVMRFMPDGSLDLTFSGDGKIVNAGVTFNTAFIGGHVLQSGNIIVCASILDVSSNSYFYSFAYDSTGVIDTTYGINGSFSDSVQLSVTFDNMNTTIQPDEKIIMVGNRISSTGIDVIRINPNGTIDNTFGTNGHSQLTFPSTIANNVAVLNNGKIMIMGFYGIGFGKGFGILLNTNGTIDSTFGTNGFRVFDLNANSGHALNNILELPSGAWLAGGSANSFFIKKYTDLSNVPHISQSIGLLTTTGIGTYQWFLNGLPISAATQSTFAFTQNGIYTMMITNAEGCTYLSDPFTVNNVLVTEIFSSSINIYPNPVLNELTVSGLKFNIGDEIKIIDVVGKEIYSHKIEQETSNLKINTLAFLEGIYFIKIKSGDKKGVARFVKIN